MAHRKEGRAYSLPTNPRRIASRICPDLISGRHRFLFGPDELRLRTFWKSWCERLCFPKGDCHEENLFDGRHRGGDGGSAAGAGELPSFELMGFSITPD